MTVAISASRRPARASPRRVLGRGRWRPRLTLLTGTFGGDQQPCRPRLHAITVVFMRQPHTWFAAPQGAGIQRAPVMIEALAYLGGAIVLVGAMLIGAQYWPDLGTGARLLIVGSAAVALLAGGLASPSRSNSVTRRLRSVLWLLSTAAGSAFWVLLGHEALDWPAKDTALLAGLSTSVYAAVLWYGSRTWLQQFVTFAATLEAAGTAAAHLDGAAWPGIAIWAASLAWLTAARRGVFTAKRVAQAIAAAGLIVGAALPLPDDPAIVFALATAGALIVAGVLWREIAVVLVGAVGLVQFLPVAVTTWFPGRAAAPAALLLAGAVLVTAAVVLARRSAANAVSRPAIDPERYDAVVFDIDGLLPDTAVRPGLARLIHRLQSVKVVSAAISLGGNCAEALRSAGLDDAFGVRVDGMTLAELSLPGPPDPAVLLLATHRLGARPRRTVVVGAAPSDLAAARAGGFGLIIAVDLTTGPDALRAAGADVVVRDLDEIIVPGAAERNR